MTEKNYFPSLRELNETFSNGLSGALGLIGGSVAPQTQPLPPFMLGCRCPECRERQKLAFPRPSMSEQIQAAMRQMRESVRFEGFAQAVRPTRRAGRPYGYWQWNNGKLAPLYSSLDLPQTEDGMYTDTNAFYSAWDRSLGCFVSYAR